MQIAPFLFAATGRGRCSSRVRLCDAMPYLLKTEPSTYSFADLQREGTTIWDGVSNPVALRNLRSMTKGEDLVIYHTGDEKSAVGTAKVVSVDASDAKNPQVQISAGKPLKTPHTLGALKANKLFADSPLVRQGRLSVVPLTDAQWKFLLG
jgi:predicted RNA-binding protein with PUA-like domain